MPGSLSRLMKSPSGSWLDRRRQQREPHPLAFTCGVRVVHGSVAGERTRWRYRVSAVDSRDDDPIVLNHGSDVTLRLTDVTLQPGERTRPGHRVLRATEVTAGATLQLSVPVGEVASFGVEV